VVCQDGGPAFHDLLMSKRDAEFQVLRDPLSIRAVLHRLNQQVVIVHSPLRKASLQQLRHLAH